MANLVAIETESERDFPIPSSMKWMHETTEEPKHDATVRAEDVGGELASKV